MLSLRNVILYYGLSQIIACASAPTPDYSKNIENKTFKHDLLVDVNGTRFKGIGVAKKASTYHIIIYPTEKIDRLTYTTCHLQQTIDQPKTGWFSGKFEFDLTDIPGVTDVHACSLQILAMNEDNRVNMFALIEFQDTRPEISLPATVKCNGDLRSYPDGVSICQTAAGLVEQISFNETVIQKGSSPQCDVMKSIDDKTFTYFMPSSNCTYYFSSQRKINGKRVSHRLETLGFTEVPVSGVD
jgi:hypothetical protein